MTPDDLAEDRPSQPNFLQAVRRRWPWGLLGIAVGLVGGFLAYTSKPPIYQSTGQVLVIRKRVDIGPTTDSRSVLVEDYVASQVQVLKSERILNIAAGKLADITLRNTQLPDSQSGRADYLKAVFNVTREKDPTAAGTTGTNVLNLSVRGSDPEDCQTILNLIIDTYKKELKTIYETATTQRLQLLEDQLKGYKGDVRDLTDQIKNANTDIRNKTGNEDPTSLRTRVSVFTTKASELSLEKSELARKLELIQQVGPNDLVARRRVLAMLGDTNQSQTFSKIDFDQPENLLRQIELEREETFRRYNVDHPDVKRLDSRIGFIKQLLKERLDPLEMYKLFVDRRMAYVKDAFDQIDAALKDDRKKLESIIAPMTIVETSQMALTARNKTIDEVEIQRRQTELTRDAGGFDAEALNKPSISNVPVEPRLSQMLALGAVLGLLAGAGMGTLAELSDKSFRSAAEIRRRLGLPVIGHVPNIRVSLPPDVPLEVDASLVSALRPKSTEAEAYRGLRTALYYSTQGKGHQLIQVTSPNPGDGKSTLAANLAVSIAQTGKRVVLLDADFRKPRVHRIFKLSEPGPGLAAMVAGSAELHEAAIRTPVENLTLLPCGTRPANPAELITSPRFKDVLEMLRREFDFVIVDTPPLLAVSDPSAIANRVDGVLLTFRMTKKARPSAERAREQLAQLGANVIGVVVNGAGRTTDGYGYGYGYGYNYEYSEYQDEYADPSEYDLPRKG